MSTETRKSQSSWWYRISRWFAPGMNVKRWLLLILLGLSMLAVAVMVLVDFTNLGAMKRFVIDFLIDVFVVIVDGE